VLPILRHALIHAGDVVYTTVFTRRMIIINSTSAVQDLLERRASVYSQRPYQYLFEVSNRLLSVFNIPTEHARFRTYRRLLHGELAARAQNGAPELLRRQTLRMLQHIAKEPELFQYYIRLCVVRQMHRRLDLTTDAGTQARPCCASRTATTRSRNRTRSSCRRTALSRATHKPPQFGSQTTTRSVCQCDCSSWCSADRERSALSPDVARALEAPGHCDGPRDREERGDPLQLVQGAHGSCPAVPTTARLTEGVAGIGRVQRLLHVPAVARSRREGPGSGAGGHHHERRHCDLCRRRRHCEGRPSVSSVALTGWRKVSSALATFVLLMTLHPDVQEKARVELDASIGRDRLPTEADFGRKDMPYVAAVIKETLRWAPPVPLGNALLARGPCRRSCCVAQGSLTAPSRTTSTGATTSRKGRL
jgi:hypothetical protein